MQRQLDLFDDGRDVGLRNDLAQALLDGDPVAAQRSADTLQAEFGADTVLPPAALLIENLHWRQSLAADSSLEATQVLHARQHLEGPVTAAAHALFGAHEAPPWLQGQWCWLATLAAPIGWHPAHAEAHAAGLYLHGQAWPQAAAAVASIGSWRRIPVPLLWMTQARWRGEGADVAWPLLAEALWLAPARAAALLPALADTRLSRLVARFEEHFDPAAAAAAEWAWLPAFALVDQPLLAGPLEKAKPPTDSAAGQAFSTVMALLRLERQGRHHEIIAHRARLQALSITLFAAYMATR